VDATGRIVSQPLTGMVIEAGTHILDVDTNALPAGLYTLRLTTATGTESSSIIKVIR